MLSRFFMILMVFVGSSSVSALPETELVKRQVDVAKSVREKLEISEFVGSGGKRLGWAKIAGDKNLPPIVISVGLGESYVHYEEFFYDLLTEVANRPAVFIFDLRSQGFSERISSDKSVLHIESFDDYVADLDIFLQTVVKPEYPLQARIIAHSTGGLVAFRLLAKKPDLAEKVIFVAPLFGINYGATPRWVISLLANTLNVVGFHDKRIPFRNRSGLPPFAENFLTFSPERYARIVAMQDILPKPESTGPSVGFVVATQDALADSEGLLESFPIPSVVMTADQDVYVSTPDAVRFCSRMPKCELVQYTSSRHVLLHERDDIRKQVIGKIKDFILTGAE